MSFAPDVIDPPPPFLMRTDSEYERKRLETWASKEPETIAWIASFADGDVFFDIGANVGVYSLYCAAVHPRCAIIACEPDRKNFASLCENIRWNISKMNRWDRSYRFANVLAAQFAIGSQDGWGTFYEAGAVTGESGGQVNAALCNGMAAYPVRVRSIDSIVAEYGCPTHVKIDIDGQELAVVRGMRETIRNNALRTVLIEIDLSCARDKEEIYCAFERNGFLTYNQFNMMLPHSRTRRAAQGIGVENVVFTRER